MSELEQVFPLQWINTSILIYGRPRFWINSAFNCEVCVLGVSYSFEPKETKKKKQHYERTSIKIFLDLVMVIDKLEKFVVNDDYMTSHDIAITV